MHTYTRIHIHVCTKKRGGRGDPLPRSEVAVFIDIYIPIYTDRYTRTIKGGAW